MGNLLTTTDASAAPHFSTTGVAASCAEDALGGVRRQLWRRRQTASITDELGRTARTARRANRLSVATDAFRTRAWTYNAAGQVTSYRPARPHHSYTYDNLNRRVETGPADGVRATGMMPSQPRRVTDPWAG
jgi:YD repeat-containing protein